MCLAASAPSAAARTNEKSYCLIHNSIHTKMKKFFVLLAALVMLPLAAEAQKFGNINMNDVFEAMPERTQIQKDLEALQAKYESELTKMGDEYQKKVSDFLAQQDSLAESIARARAEEIDQLQQRIQNFREMAAKDMQSQQQQKVGPVIEKINRAIQAVGEKNGFTYIFDTANGGQIVYFSPSQCVDVLPLVKAELGLK